MGRALILIVLVAALLGMPGQAVQAQDAAGSDIAVIAKLEVVLANQKAIMESLAAIKEELEIVKIRVSQNQ